MDITRVAQIAAGECIRQHVGIERLWTLIAGYEIAAGWTRDDLTSANIERLAGIVEPDNNGRFRITPVTFDSGGTAAEPGLVRGLMDSLTTHGDMLDAMEWTREFLWTHPFTDGNGRTAWVIYNLLNGTMDYPEPLPEFF